MDSNRQPWVKRDIDKVLAEPRVANVRGGKFVGLHVRRGDKLRREAKRIEIEASVYVSQSKKEPLTIRQGILGILTIDTRSRQRPTSLIASAGPNKTFVAVKWLDVEDCPSKIVKRKSTILIATVV